MNTVFVNYKDFPGLPDAQYFLQQLRDNHIEFQVEDLAPVLDEHMIGATVSNKLRVKIKAEDFERVEEMERKLASSMLDQISKDHYLYAFSQEELMEIIEKPDEWSKIDYLLAQKLLIVKGLDVSDETLERKRAERMKELRKPERVNLSAWNVFFRAMGGGIWGLLHAWHYMTLKKVMPDGERVYMYDLPTRRKAEKLLWIGIFMTIVWILAVWYYIDNDIHELLRNYLR